MAFNFPSIGNGGSVTQTYSNPYSQAASYVTNAATSFMAKVTQVVKSTPLPPSYGSLTQIPSTPSAVETVVTREIKLEEIPELKAVDKASKELSRFVLANPSTKAINECNTFYDNFIAKAEHYKLDKKDIDDTMKAVPDARASNGTKQNPDEAQRLLKHKELLDNVKSKPHSYCNDGNFAIASADRESIETGLGYRAINAPWIPPIVNPSDGMTTLLNDIRKGGYLVAPIGKEFKERSMEDMNNNTEKKGIYLPQGTQDEIPGVCGPLPGLPERAFTPGSYVAKTINEGMPGLAHVSGSMPLTLAVDEFVMNKGEKKEKTDPQAIRQAGAVFTTLYDVGAYHTIVESAAGVVHYIQEATGERITDKERPTLDKVDPRTFLAMGIGMMNGVVDENKLPEFNGKVQELLEKVETTKQVRQEKLRARQEAKEAKTKARELKKTNGSQS